MKMLNTKRKRRVFISLAVTFAVLIVLFAVCAIYVSDYYRAEKDKIDDFTPKMSSEVYKNGYISFGNEGSETGFIFYPGGKVEYSAYIPLMRLLSGEGVFCVLLEMPFNLAVLDADAAEEIYESYPNIKEWYVGGHSLGGSMAASCLSDNAEKFAGLVLLGSYSTADLSSLGVRVLSTYGSEDGVMNREKYESNLENLPEDYKEVVIEGGCHAYFGMYGEQDGDGKATITQEEQIYITADSILDFVYENE